MHAGPGILKVTMPDFALNVDPFGSGGYPAFGVTLTFGALEAPPVYFKVGVVQTGEVLLSVQLAVVVVHAIWRNTKIALGTPAASLDASSTRTTNEKLPGAVGLPVTLPVEDRTTPGGSAPELMDHLYGFTPPAAPRVTVA